MDRTKIKVFLLAALVIAIAFPMLASAKEQPSLKGLSRVMSQDFTSDAQRRFLISGSPWQYPTSAVSTESVAADAPARTIAFGESVSLRFAGLKKKADYKLKLEFLSDSTDRVQRLFIDSVLVQDDIKLAKGSVLEIVVDVPRSAYEDGQIEIKAVRKAGPNAVFATVELWSNDKSILAYPDIIAAGNLAGEIAGVVRDINGTMGVDGVLVEVATDGSNAKVSTTTDAKGAFRVMVPSKWRDITSDTFKVTASKDGINQSVYVLSEQVFRPRLTPAPLAVNDVEQLKVDLNGQWKFIAKCPADLSKITVSKADTWGEIEVPGEWVMQGYTVEKDTAAAYFRQFEVPSEWGNKRVKLRFDAVYSEADVWVNGKNAGFHFGGMTPFEFDVTDLVTAGTNTISLAVKNESLADVLASGTQYAVHQMGGISRKAYLFAVPELNIASMHVETVFDEDYRNATLRILLDIANESGRDVSNAKLKFDLKTHKTQKKVRLSKNTSKLPTIKAGQMIRHIVEMAVSNPDKWDNEHPNLYDVQCVLQQGFGSVETVNRRFGFRQIEVRGNQLFVNDKPVKLHGVNRHEAHPLRGRSLTPELWRKDAEMFMAGNCNYIRTSHYPPAEEFIEICDELGLFVEEEAPLCWVGHGANATWKKWDPHSSGYLRTILKGTMEMIERDRSHPSVLIWSLANESQWGPNFEKSFELANLADPTRPKSFHDQNWGGWNNNGSYTQVANYHYPGPDGFKRAVNAERPLLFGEYCHLNAYNRLELVTDPSLRDAWGRGLAKMWEGMNSAKGSLGGALWSGIDDTFFLPNGQTVGYGTWGPIDGWRREKPEYWHMKKIYSPIKVTTKQIKVPVAGKAIEIELENRHDFTNVNELRIEWKIEGQAGTTTADIAARSKGSLEIPCKTKGIDGKTLSLEFLSPKGFVIDSYLIPIGSNTKAVANKSVSVKLTYDEADAKVTVSYGINSVVFDDTTGMILEAKIAGKTVITGGPYLMLLPLSGAGGTQMTGTDRYDAYTASCTNWQASNVDVTMKDDSFKIKVNGAYDQAKGSYTISIGKDGLLRISYDFESLVDVNPRQVGIVFDLDRSCDTLSWDRKGLWTIYPADHIGRLSGSAKAFVGTLISGSAGSRIEPSWSWSHDNNALGSNDFRSTKENINWASLTSDDGASVKVISDTTQSVRAWIENDKTHMLVADYVNPGAERFFRGHARVEDKPLKKGDKIDGTVVLKFMDNN